MAFDGTTEIAAFNALLDMLAEPWYEGIPDDTELPPDWTGAPTGYYEVSYGQPVAAARGRGLAVNEGQQPHVLPIRVTTVSGSKAKTNEMVRALLNAVVGVTLSSNSSDVKSVGGGYSYPVTATESKPTEWRADTYLQVYNNYMSE